MDSINRIKFDLILRNITLHRRGQMRAQLLIRPQCIKQKFTAFLEPSKEIVLSNIGLLRAGDKVRLIDEIWTHDWRLPKTQMTHRNTARFLRVIGKICLGIHVRLVANDLNGTLVRTDCAVRTKPPEFTCRCPLFRKVDIAVNRLEAAMRHIIFDAERKAVHRLILLELLIDCKNLIRRCVFSAEAITAADNNGVHTGAVISRLNVEVERLTESSWLLRSVENSNLLYRLWKIFEEMLDRERSVEVNR